MLHYFGQQYDKNCGHCDVCQSNKRHQVSTKTIEAAIFEVLKNAGENSITGICTALPGYTPADITTSIRAMIDDGVVGIRPGNIIYRK